MTTLSTVSVAHKLAAHATNQLSMEETLDMRMSLEERRKPQAEDCKLLQLVHASWLSVQRVLLTKHTSLMVR